MTSPHRTIGPYRIDRELGRGGMGVVHLGHDTRLDRAVAIKELPEALSQDPDLLARFEREARTLAQLDHPNVTSIYGLEEQDGRRYLVLEYVDGESLADRLQRGPLPLDEALAIAAQIAAGVAAAHDAGVIHRDLKPGNVIVRPDGRASVLDFGLARSASDDGRSVSSSAHAATLVSPVANSPTIAGVILGTAAYMSPEQARGRMVDRRTDVWSFGIVLFEMLSGQRLFDGETVSDCIAAVLQRDVDFAKLPADTPAGVRSLLAQCLERDVARRRRDIGDVGMELERIRRGASPLGAAEKPKASATGRIVSAVAVAAALVLALLWLRERGHDLPSAPPLVASINTPVGTELSLNMSNPSLPVVSPDGRWLVYGARDLKQNFRLQLCDLSRGTTVALEGTDQGQYPFWSPDSRSIGFFASNRGLLRMERDGGPPRVLADHAGNGKGGAWTQDGRIVYARGPRSGLSIISAEGGESSALSELDPANDDLSQRHPRLLPGDEALLYFRRNTATVAENAPGEIRVRRIDGSDDRMLVQSLGQGVYDDGHLLYVTDGVLVARPFDPNTLQFNGESRPIADDVLVLGAASLAAFDVSPSGALTYVSRRAVSQRERLIWHDRNGRPLQTVLEDIDIGVFELLPGDDRIVANLVGQGDGELTRGVVDLGTGAVRRLEEAIPSGSLVLVSHDGRRYAHFASGSAGFTLWVSPLDSYGAAQLVGSVSGTTRFIVPSDWSPDDRQLYVARTTETEDWEWFLYDVDAQREPQSIEAVPLSRALRPSPDGRWVAYEALHRGDPQLFVSRSGKASAAVRVTDAPVASMQWRVDGKELYIHYRDGRLLALDTSVDSPQDFGTARLMFDVGISPNDWGAGHARVSQDGQRVLVSLPMDTDRFGTFTLMTDWRASIGR